MIDMTCGLSSSTAGSDGSKTSIFTCPPADGSARLELPCVTEPSSVFTMNN